MKQAGFLFVMQLENNYHPKVVIWPYRINNLIAE
jgi:hypothetical protein